MAYGKEWLLEPKYPDSAIQAGDENYLKCYAGGDAGYVSMCDQTTPGSETLISMLGNSRVEIKPETHLYWATWVPSTQRKTEAMTFTVKKKDGRTWLQASREFVCANLQPWVQLDSTRDETLPWLQFSEGRHVGFVVKTRQIGLYATKSADGRLYLNTDQVGLECVFVPEKVQEGDVNYNVPFSA
ncbi:MAG: hypothetical protein Q9205_001871 [Flavoplaca limonia]